MNSLDENYAPAVLLPAVSFISSLPKNRTSSKIFNRLNSKKHLNLSNSIFTEYIINHKKSTVSILIYLVSRSCVFIVSKCLIFKSGKGTYKNSGITEKNK